MTSGEAVRCMSGMIAKGIPNDRATCETTSAHVGSAPAPRMMSAGIREKRRRAMMGTRMWSRPFMISEPA